MNDPQVNFGPVLPPDTDRSAVWQPYIVGVDANGAEVREKVAVDPPLRTKREALEWLCNAAPAAHPGKMIEIEEERP